MPSVNLRVSLPTLDRERYLRDLRQSIRQAVVLAAQKFLQAAIPLIPVWTGMASGAMENLEILAGVSIPRASPSPRSANYYYQGQRRTPALGQSLTTQPGSILSGDMTSAETGTRLFFNFTINIDYFNELDAQWGAMEAGEAAFEQELHQQLHALQPNIGDYFVTRRAL
jgi:hypothetical protein